MTNSHYPEPKKETKRLILESLIEIYHWYKAQLEKRNQPYYLKLWLYEPRFSKSQVVYAIGKKINYYKELFFNPAPKAEFNLRHYGRLKSDLGKFSWESVLDEDHIDQSFLGKPEDFFNLSGYIETQKWFNRMMKKPHRTTLSKESNKEYYSFTKGRIWIGE